MLRFIMRISPLIRIATVTAARQSPTGPAYSRPSIPMMLERMYALGQRVEELPCQSADHSLRGLADRLEEDTRGDEEADEEDNTEEDVEALEGKLVVQFVLLSENIDNFLGEELEASPTDHTHDKTYDDSS